MIKVQSMKFRKGEREAILPQWGQIFKVNITDSHIKWFLKFMRTTSISAEGRNLKDSTHEN